MTATNNRLGMVESGIAHAAHRLGLKTEQSMAAAVESDPLAAQVGSDLEGRLASGAPATLPEVKACEADKACTAGMVGGMRKSVMGGMVSHLAGHIKNSFTP